MENALTIRDWSPEERPREKLIEKGTEALDAAELLAIIIGSGTPQKSALDLARELIHRFGGVSELARADVRDLSKVRGIGPAKAVAIVSAFELGRRRERVRSRPQHARCAREVATYFRNRLMDLHHEEFWAIYLDAQLGIISESRLGTGSRTRTLVDAMRLFGEGFQLKAHSFIVVHNHPSGSLKPSQADHHLTEELRKTGEYLLFPMRDHLIVSHQGYFSFAEERLLGQKGPQLQVAND